MNLFIHSIPNWLELTFLAFSTGLVMGLLGSPVRNPASGLPDRDKLRKRMRGLVLISIAAMIAGAGLDLLVRAAEMSVTPIIDVLPVLPTVVFHTHYGSVWLIRIVALVGMLVPAAAGVRFRESRIPLVILLLLGAVVAMTESGTGHAADKGDFTVSELVDWLHLLAASVWGGGLFALAIVIFPAYSEGGRYDVVPIAEIASRFSRVAGIAVCIIAFSALYNAWAYVGSLPILFKSVYGWTLGAKTLLLSILVGLAAFNRYVFVPRLRQAAAMPESGKGFLAPVLTRFLSSSVREREGRTAEVFVRNVRIEAVLMLAVLLCAVLLRHEVPAKHYLHQHEENPVHPHMHGGPL